MNKEIWKDIDGYEGLYQISNLGNVKSLTNRSNHKEERILKLNTNSKYYLVNLCKNTKRKTLLIHRLVAKAFIDNPNNLPQINHINGNKLDNRAVNLEWCTCRANIIHSIKNGLKVTKKGKENPMYGRKNENANRSVKVSKYDMNDNYIETYSSIREAGIKNNISEFTISNVCNGRGKSAGGYKWRYADESKRNV